MRSATTLAALRRATAAAPLAQNHRLCQSSPFSSCYSSSSSSADSNWLLRRVYNHFRSDASISSAGTVFFSVAAASSLIQDAHAKEPVQSYKFKDVVLYQYEACPFCNKVSKWNQVDQMTS